MFTRILLFLSLPFSALAFLYFLNVHSFWLYFFTIIFTVGLQYAIDKGFQSYAVIKYGFRLKQVNLDLEKEFNKRGIELTCPCEEKQKCFVPVDLQNGTSYDCTKCDKRISVYVKVGTALSTDPVIVQSLDALPLNLNE
jgi:hypothetical protein